MNIFKIIFFVFLLFLSSCKEALIHDLTELRANRVIVALADSGVKAYKKQQSGKWNVEVESNDITKALKVLEENRLLKRDLDRSSLKESSIIQTKEERRIYLERELAWGIENTLEAIPDVLEARVHLCMNLSSNLNIGEEKKAESASVLIVHRDGAKIEDRQIKQIVSGAVGIERENITVISSSRKILVKTKEIEVSKKGNTLSIHRGLKNSKFKYYMLGSAFLAVLFVIVLLKGNKKTNSKNKAKKNNLNKTTLKENNKIHPAYSLEDMDENKALIKNNILNESLKEEAKGVRVFEL